MPIGSVFFEEIKAIEQKAAKSFNNMFKAMGDKQAVFFVVGCLLAGVVGSTIYFGDQTIAMYSKLERFPFNSVLFRLVIL